MRKQELIHTHGLLVEVVEYCKSKGVSPDLEEYEAQQTRPMSIQRSKTDHKDAVFALASGLTDSFETTHVETVPTSDD